MIAIEVPLNANAIAIYGLKPDGSGDVSYNELVNQLHRFRSPDMRTAICELTKLHQKVQNLFEFDRLESRRNHTLLLDLLQTEGYVTFLWSLNATQYLFWPSHVHLRLTM